MSKAFLVNYKLFVSATTPPPPSGSALTKAVSKLVTNPRGAKILVIDKALKAYETAKASGTKQDQIKALHHVSNACAWWLNQKDGKAGTLTQARRLNIERVRDGAAEILDSLNAGEGAFATRKGAAIEAGAVQGRGQREFKNPAATQLSGGYANERKAFEQMGKGPTSVAAGWVHSNLPAGASFDALSVDEYVGTLEGEAAKGKTPGAQQKLIDKGSVEYLSRSNRAQFLVIPGGDVFNRPDGSPYDSGLLFSHVDLDMYAMDRYGNLFVRKYNGSSPGGKAGFYNHSSFVAGNEVICAGMIGIHKGTLRHIDNNSGHYKPNAAALHACVLALQQQGVNVDNVRVMLSFGDSPPNPKPVCHDGANFLINPTRPVATWNDSRNAALELQTL